MPNEWYLDTISVDERFRGMGIGSKLLDALPEVAKASGKQALGLNVDFDNPGRESYTQAKAFKDVTTMTISGHLYNHMQRSVTKLKSITLASLFFINPLMDQNLIQNHRKFLFFLLYNQ